MNSIKKTESTKTMKTVRHFPEVTSFSRKEIEGVLSLAFEMKKNPDKFRHSLEGKTLLMWFEKPSVRTRVSFEAGMVRMGGNAIYLDFATTHKNKAGIKDEIGCISTCVDIIAARVFSHGTIEEMMKASGVPVINALCDKYHPCQALADVMTVYETIGKKAVIAYVGDGNNVCNSLINACKTLEIRIQVATPNGYKPISTPDLWTNDPKIAVMGADAVYTDTWVSMGQEKEAKKKEKIFRGYQVNKKLIGERYFMHCLPAIRGNEVTDEVIDSEKSLIFRQAENRMYVQNAIIATLLKK